ncbi:helix-turn-helix domain-containing protein [Gordonia sp. TBRC 11910]|uniref:Helix-turn-helix domain-containing protein n=1 Tax=Gordonia asplenii TaxID=2725283 RepID=A0A848KPR8_9ACTN|nr:helix-turn-helix domain-containing protein [Gordonia asplenii]NMO00232.1 helix-turn-helix domain-containing protein [Gordonia asplenii]
MTDTPEFDAVAAIAILDEPARRALYDYVAAASGSVGRDDVAAAMQMSRSTVAFHLDKLVDAGLLTVEYVRRTGRRGPGAGRPAKMYTRSSRTIAMHLPSRAYELAGQLMAAAIEGSAATGENPTAILTREAASAGQAIGAQGRTCAAGGLTDILRNCGYEPRNVTDSEIDLINCPFHSLAQRHTAMICSMNKALLEGILVGADHAGEVRAELSPAQGRCCVQLRRDPADNDGRETREIPRSTDA